MTDEQPATGPDTEDNPTQPAEDTTPPVDFRTASRADVAAELARHGTSLPGYYGNPFYRD